MNIRSTAKAVIVRDNEILLNRYQAPEVGEYYTLPGGGQQKYETIEEAVIRECREETGYTVVPDAFIALYEEIYTHPFVRQKYSAYAHKIMCIFRCSLGNVERMEILESDEWQLGCAWMDLKEISKTALYPVAIRENIARLVFTETPLYLGTHILHRKCPI